MNAFNFILKTIPRALSRSTLLTILTDYIYHYVHFGENYPQVFLKRDRLHLIYF